ncbi:MAG: magnesium transporter [Planctomycetota bacterium]
MANTLYLPELREMLRDHDEAGMHEFCTALHPARTADYMQALDPDEAWEILQHAEPALRSEIFGYLTHALKIAIIESADRKQVAELIAETASDDRVDILEDIDPDIVKELMELLPRDERRDIMRLAAFPEGTAGAIMTTGVAVLPESLTVSEALQALGRQSEELETIYYIYVVDDDNHLRGVVSARQLVSNLGKPNTAISELMESDVVSVQATDDQEDVARKVARYDLLAIPVVDEEHRMLGIITHDDVIDVVREEATEDAHRIGAVGPLEDSYLQTRLITLSWKRGVWLLVLFATGALTALAMRHYHVIQEKWVWLGWFVPLIISSGGNSGSQSATLVITAMATGDISLGDWLRVLWREMLIGVMLGAALALVGFLAAWMLLGNVQQAVILLVTLLLVVLCGTLSGSALPLVFRRLGLDPALMSTPFVAAIIDVVGIVIYMNMALFSAHYLFPEPEPEVKKPASDVKANIADVKRQDLALNFERSDQDPDLIGAKLLGIRFRQSLQFIRHGGMLVGSRLETQSHFLPCLCQNPVIAKIVDGRRTIAQKQAEASHVARIGSRLKLLNAFG